MSTGPTMTEAEWNASADVAAMLRFVQGLLSTRERMYRFFAAACCRLVWDVVKDRNVQRAAEVAEEVAEGRHTPSGRIMEATHKTASAAAGRAKFKPFEQLAAEAFVAAAASVAITSALDASQKVQQSLLMQDKSEEAAAVCHLARDIFHPFGPVRLPQSWRSWESGKLLSVAQCAYDERHLPDGTLDMANLGILSDALQDAGCVDEVAIAHLKEHPRHVRGCFVLDAILYRP